MDCEGLAYQNSGWKHLNPNGSYDFGPAQINSVHTRELESLGLDITKWQDTVRYAFILLNREGTQPWSASETCWQ